MCYIGGLGARVFHSMISTFQNSSLTLQRFFQIASVPLILDIFEKESLNNLKGHLFFRNCMSHCLPSA